MTEPADALNEWLAPSGGRVGLVTTDLVRSTSLLHASGTLNYADMLRSHRARAETLIEVLDGRLLDDSADGIFAAFPSVTSAVAFAEEFFHRPGHPQLRIRGGVHFGRVRALGGTLVGRNMHLAARVRQHADGPELWLSGEARSQLEAESPGVASAASWLADEEVLLQGFPDKQRLWRLA